MNFYSPFVIPFVIGAGVMFAVIAYKYIRWFYQFTREQKKTVARNIFSVATLSAVWESVSESLLHRRIFKTNPLLGYMQASLAFGWFLLIAVGWIETIAYLGFRYVPLHGHVFFKFFSVTLDHTSRTAVVFSNLMDALLLVVLSGVMLAWFKRTRSRMLGMRKTTKHVTGDRVALSALWLIFPLRLVAESITAGLYHNGGFLTGTIGNVLHTAFGDEILSNLLMPSWWAYSIALGVFFIAMPFSRYMHIFTEIPLIFLRKWGLHSTAKQSSFDHFQTEACSRCGICIDPCQLQSQAGYNEVQSVYFLRDRRYNMLSLSVADNCLMCGRCQSACPVGVELDSLRLNSRNTMRGTPSEARYDYLNSTLDRSTGKGKVGYFAGCMTLLTPKTLISMQRIFDSAGEEVWWADREGGACCGRPLKLSGEVVAAEKMINFNRELFKRHNITTLITSCPICLRVFREEYNLEGIELLHHSQYIARLIAEGRISPNKSNSTYTYHDPCELGRGLGIYSEPRAVIRTVGVLIEPKQSGQDALCCGSSVANIAIDDIGQKRIATSVGTELEKSGAETIVSACPQCKKALGRGTNMPIADLSEIIADAI